MDEHPFDEPEPLGPLPDPELSDLIRRLTEREQAVSYERRILHAQIDVLRAERVARLRRRGHDGS